MSLSDLMAQRDALDRQIAELKSETRASAIAEIRKIMEESGLSLADLTGGPKKASSNPSSGSKVAAKYINKATGDTWSGRGLKPKWLTAALEAGGKLEDFAV